MGDCDNLLAHIRSSTFTYHLCRPWRDGRNSHCSLTGSTFLGRSCNMHSKEINGQCPCSIQRHVRHCNTNGRTSLHCHGRLSRVAYFDFYSFAQHHSHLFKDRMPGLCQKPPDTSHSAYNVWQPLLDMEGLQNVQILKMIWRTQLCHPAYAPKGYNGYSELELWEWVAFDGPSDKTVSHKEKENKFWEAKQQNPSLFPVNPIH